MGRVMEQSYVIGVTEFPYRKYFIREYFSLGPPLSAVFDVPRDCQWFSAVLAMYCDLLDCDIE